MIENEETVKEKIIHFIPLLPFVLLIPLAAIVVNHRRNIVEADHRFTVAEVYSCKFHRNTTRVKYTYSVEDIIYSDWAPSYISDENKLLNKKFLLKFNPKKPKWNIIMLESPIPEWVEKPPRSGWEKVPQKPKNKKQTN
jgi:hypothetical protein